MRRPLLDLSAQLLPVVSQLIERIFLTGILVQRLGVGQFERWSLISATVTLLTVVDLGTQITFSNRMARAAHRGDEDEAVAIFGQSNSIFASLGAIVMTATILFATLGPLQYWLGLNPPLDNAERIVALCLGGAIALKLAMTNASGVYRSMMAFGRGTLVVTVGDLLRIFAGIAALLLFGSIEALAIAMAGATVLAFAVIIPLDLARKFPRFAWRLRRPTALTTKGTFSESILFAASYLPSIVLTQIPIMLIGSRAAQGVLAGYVLMRTIANVVRTLSQKVTFIVGMEFSRLETQGRLSELATAYRYLSALVALAFGCGCALLWTWGGTLLRLWSGTASLYDPLMLAIMLAPLIIVPGTQLNLSLLIYGHRPGSFAVAVVLQTAASLLLALLLPVESIALRLSLALTIAEILFLAPVIAVATRRMIGLVAMQSVFRNFLVAMGAAVVTGGSAMFVRSVVGDRAGLVLSSALIFSLVAPLIWVTTRKLVHSMRIGRRPDAIDAEPIAVQLQGS